MATVLVIIHGLVAVALLGAITHQTLATLAPANSRAGSFFGRFRAVPSPAFTNAIVLLYVVAALLGAVVYLYFRVDIRPVLERDGHWQALGFFDLKEHFNSIGLALLPAYWVCWRQPLADELGALARRPFNHHRVHRLVELSDRARHEQHHGLRFMMAAPSFRNFAFAFGAAFAVFYVVALAGKLALFTVFPSLGIVLPGNVQTKDFVDPAMGFLALAIYWYGWTARRVAFFG